MTTRRRDEPAATNLVKFVEYALGHDGARVTELRRTLVSGRFNARHARAPVAVRQPPSAPP